MEQQKITGYPSIDKPWLKYYTEVQNTEPFHGTLYQHIYENNKDYPKDIAIQYFGRNIPYGDMFENIERVSKAFTAYGIKKGDNVALLMSSCPELVYFILGINKIGAVGENIPFHVLPEFLRILMM